MSSLPHPYEAQIAAERRFYRDCTEVHSLPPIFHYWSNRWLRPALEPFGLIAVDDVFVRTLELLFPAEGSESRSFVSLGSGNCDLEIQIARRLIAAGRENFVFECVDLNASMLERGRDCADAAGIGHHFRFTEADLNLWLPPREFDGALANQSLHHVVNLEHLFTEVSRSLLPGGRFVISDMIGRNGHLRWPEALDIVHELWRALPPSYRFNRTTSRYEELFEDHDCSGEGFEGVRSQDILPLLSERFRFRFFFPFGNIVDPFLDRSFGPNFDPSREWDRRFIDQVHERDVRELNAGHVTPTHMIAVVQKDGEVTPEYPGHLSPEFCLRHTDRPRARAIPFPAPLYRWEEYPADAAGEMERLCASLSASAASIAQKQEWAVSLERESALRLEWGNGLAEQLETTGAWALTLREQLAERTAWAVNLREELVANRECLRWARGEIDRLIAEREEHVGWARRVDCELEEKTAWSLRLRSDLEAQSRRAERLERELRGYLRNPIRLLGAIAQRVWARLAGHT